MKVLLIRHSKTKGNLEKRYIGTTDESLIEEGINLAKSKSFPKVQVVYASPLKRCIETAKIVYKDLEPVIYDGLRECDFGEFENKNYKELSGNANYQKWIDSNGKLPFPGGEDVESFKERCVNSFMEVIDNMIERKIDTGALVVHGGTIMAILDKFSKDERTYYDFQVKNCEGYVIEIDNSLWTSGKKEIVIKEKME
ncbi:MAG: histidine phosphatase family protein [Clostridium sp.]|nr:histidine phosphatase family protein [Clostridium sp.]